MQPALRLRLRGKTSPFSKTMSEAEAEAESSGGEEESAASTSTRGSCGQFVWPCPREYPVDVGERRKQKWLIPADLQKEEMGLLFKDMCTKLGLGPAILKIHVFDEPHKRYNMQTKKRQRHKHLVFKMASNFAHLKLKKMFMAHGIYGHFSFNLVGYVAYLRYCLCQSAKKLAADLDQQPWSWPPVPASSLLALCEQISPQMDARNGLPGVRGAKRKLMTFSELADAFVERGVKTERDAWILAKSRKVIGDDTLFNTLGAASCVRLLVAKVRAAWDCELMSTGTLVTKPDYALDCFIPLGSVDARLVKWMKGEWKHKTLVLSGDPGMGKTELGCAMMHATATSTTFHFVNKQDRIKDVLFTPGEGLVYDEACLAENDVDDAKAIVDIVKTRDVACRNKDGCIPSGTPRIFSTNWTWAQFWPREALAGLHAGAIKRRVLWVNVNRDVRKDVITNTSLAPPSSASAPPVLPISTVYEDHDPFGNGFGLDEV